MTENPTKRNFGLDIIRSIAILMVLVGHAIPDDAKNTKILFTAHIFRGYGVELFFVLSGFLIGGILLNLYQKEAFKSHIKTFYIRRWFRTLPLYYLVLLIYTILYYFGEKLNNLPLDFLFKYFIFIQNFDIRHFHFFNQSWSLSVEEWFYLILPIIFLFFSIKKIKPEEIYKSLLKIIGFIVIFKFFYILSFNPEADYGIRRFIPVRFDSLLIGVLFSSLKINNNKLYKMFLTKKALILSFSVILFSIFFPSTANIFSAFSYTVLSFLLIVLVIYFEQNNFINEKLSKIFIIKEFFEKTSLYSYSMYLSHLFIMFAFQSCFENFYSGSFPLIIYFITLYLFSAFLYRYFEKPIMNLREKF